jgi:hypothetical protein
VAVQEALSMMCPAFRNPARELAVLLEKLLIDVIQRVRVLQQFVYFTYFYDIL